MITAGCKTASTVSITKIEGALPLTAEIDSRTRALLGGAIVPTILRLADSTGRFRHSGFLTGQTGERSGNHPRKLKAETSSCPIIGSAPWATAVNLR
jgi:hypothetical protein